MQMGSQFKPGIFDEGIRSLVDHWATGHRHDSLTSMPSSIDTSQINRLEREPYHGVYEEQERIINQRIISSAIELFPSSQNQETFSS